MPNNCHFDVRRVSVSMSFTIGVDVARFTVDQNATAQVVQQRGPLDHSLDRWPHLKDNSRLNEGAKSYKLNKRAKANSSMVVFELRWRGVSARLARDHSAEAPSV